MTKTQIKLLLFFFISLPLILTSCPKPSDRITEDTSVTKKIALVIPLTEEKDLQKHFTKTTEWFLSNLEEAMEGLSTPFTLDIEWYDEDTIDLETTAETLASRDDILAIVGPLTSPHVQIFAEKCYKTQKALIVPDATSETLARSFSVNPAKSDRKNPFLWSLAEPDISQAEALISKISSHGGKSMALISCANLYGDTFYEWVPFLAEEMGMTLIKNIRYSTDPTDEYYYEDVLSLEEAAESVVGSGADYVICALYSEDDAEEIFKAKGQNILPSLFFTDTMFSNDFINVWKKYETSLYPGDYVEGTTVYAAPETGFTVTYQSKFNDYPAVGEAQLYDALLLAGFAIKKCMEDTPETKITNAEINAALKDLVTNSSHSLITKCWTAEGMNKIFSDLEKGENVSINGASGYLFVDREILTSLSSSVYAHWTINNDRFVIYDYTSSEASNHVNQNKTSWFWTNTPLNEEEYSKIIEEGNKSTVTYEELKDQQAVLVAASSGWINYRHQADVLYLYQLLKSKGFTDDKIILIMEDDIAYNSQNLYRGQVHSRLTGENVYHDLEIDYFLEELTAQDVSDILTGVKKDEDGIPVLNTDKHTNLLLFWSGHGTNEEGNPLKGKFKWAGMNNTKGFDTALMDKTLQLMEENQRYRKLLLIAETCYSASVLNVAEGRSGVLAFAASGGSETSFADLYSVELKVWLTNRFSRVFFDEFEVDNGIDFSDLYKELVKKTIGSHVKVFNAGNYGTLSSGYPSEFLVNTTSQS